MTAAVGRPLQVDLTTHNRTRPSCARVKVEVDILGEFPKRINIGMRKKSGKIMEKWVTIKYDYVIHPELFPQEENKEEKEQKSKNKEDKRDNGDIADGKGAKGKKQEQDDRGYEEKERVTKERKGKKGNETQPSQQKSATQQESKRRGSETWSSNLHLKEDKIDLEQSSVKQENEGERTTTKEVEKEDDLPRKEAARFLLNRLIRKSRKRYKKS
ncbi:hypothetical protein H5410_026714 [Solanum commersonii]|uniref:Uncharacterized protein n=1 Tax=Solanum commersonii TaxID=4109 RepID=A0A9J5Z2B2_SOLCO|nr:hypothetical protein H5410_026714 [Solanum commersonii]